MSIVEEMGRNKYNVLHAYLRYHNPKPKACSHCKRKDRKLTWANITGIYDGNIKNYKALCSPCHINLDRGGSLTHCIRGHKREKRNRYIYPNGDVECKLCRKATHAIHNEKRDLKNYYKSRKPCYCGKSHYKPERMKKCIEVMIKEASRGEA